jgi:adenylate kinase family enzyme
MKRIVIVGVSASGKSTFARELGKKINLPVIFMDEIMWNPGWNYIGDEATIARLEEESQKDTWIIEGYITKNARTFVFERADAIIYLNYPPWIASCRYIKRWWKHRIHPRPELKDCPEKFSFKFLKLVWTKGEAISLNTFLKEVPNQSKIIPLRSPKEAADYLKNIS